MSHAVKEDELEMTFLAYWPDCLDEQIQREILFRGKDASCPWLHVKTIQPTISGTQLKSDGTVSCRGLSLFIMARVQMTT